MTPFRWRTCAFSARATRAACVLADGNGRLLVEAWSFAGEPRASGATPIDAGPVQPVAAEDGRVVLVRNDTGRHEVAVLGQGPFGTFEAQALRAFPSPDPSTLAWLVVLPSTGRTRLQRLDGTADTAESVLELPGRLVGEG